MKSDILFGFIGFGYSFTGFCEGAAKIAGVLVAVIICGVWLDAAVTVKVKVALGTVLVALAVFVTVRVALGTVLVSVDVNEFAGVTVAVDVALAVTVKVAEAVAVAVLVGVMVHDSTMFVEVMDIVNVGVADTTGV